MAEFFRGMGARRNVGIGRGRGRGRTTGGRTSFIQFVTPPRFIGGLTITGQTLDSTGVALASCTVVLELSSDGSRVASTTSDGSGNYTFVSIASGTNYQLNAYLPGSPDVAGITLNTIVGS